MADVKSVIPTPNVIGRATWPSPPNTLTIVSLFRDRERILPTYFKQIETILGFDKVHVVCVENDSKDKTRQKLEAWDYPFKHIIGNPTHQPLYGSVVHPERMRILSAAANLGLDYVSTNLNTKYVMFMESDILWEPSVPQRLCKSVAITDGIISPMVYTGRERLFYDIWAFRDDEMSHWLPFSQDYYERHLGQQLLPVWSSGTCVCFHLQALHKGVRFQAEDAIVGFCRSARKKNYRILVDTSVSVYHPQ